LWYHLDSNQGHKDFQSFSCTVRTVTKTALIAFNKRFYDFFFGYANLLCPFCALFLVFFVFVSYVFYTPLKQRNIYCKTISNAPVSIPFIDMGTKLKPIEKIGINRGIMVNDRLCVIKEVNEYSSIVEYNDGDKETIKFGTLIDPLEAPIILVYWNS